MASGRWACSAEGEITEADHDTIGLVMTKSIAHLISLTPKGWAMVQKIINESREVHYNR